MEDPYLQLNLTPSSLTGGGKVQGYRFCTCAWDCSSRCRNVHSSPLLPVLIFNFLLHLHLPSLPPPNKYHHPWAFLTTLSITAYADDSDCSIFCPLLACLRPTRQLHIHYLHPEIPTDTSNSKCQSIILLPPLILSAVPPYPVNSIMICLVPQAFGIPLP